MTERGNVADTDTGGDDVASVVPSVNEMIADSVAGSNGTHSGDQTELEALHFEIVGEPKSGDATETATEDAPRRRGRPRKDGTAPGTERPASKRKAEIAAELEETKRQLEAERARNDASKVSELARSIEFASHIAFGIVSQTRGPHWKVTAEEAKALGSTGAHAFAPHAQKISAQLPWMVFAGQLGAILYKRVEEDKKLIQQYGLAGENGNAR